MVDVMSGDMASPLRGTPRLSSACGAGAAAGDRAFAGGPPWPPAPLGGRGRGERTRVAAAIPVLPPSAFPPLFRSSTLPVAVHCGPRRGPRRGAGAGGWHRRGARPEFLGAGKAIVAWHNGRGRCTGTCTRCFFVALGTLKLPPLAASRSAQPPAPCTPPKVNTGQPAGTLSPLQTYAPVARTKYVSTQNNCHTPPLATTPPSRLSPPRGVPHPGEHVHARPELLANLPRPVWPVGGR